MTTEEKLNVSIHSKFITALRVMKEVDPAFLDESEKADYSKACQLIQLLQDKFNVKIYVE